MRNPIMIFKRAHSSAVRTAIRHLLVVEDEPLVAFDNEHFLVSEGYDVVATVDNATEAIALLTDRPDERAVEAVLLDVNLAGGQSRIDVARAAHAAGIAVLFLSGKLPDEARELAIAAITKPYGQRDLTAALKAVDAIISGRSPSGLPANVQLFSAR